MGVCASCCIKDSETERENTAKAYNDLVSRFNAEGGWEAAQYDLATPPLGKGLDGHHHHHHRNEEAALLSVGRHRRQRRHGYGAVENNERVVGTSNRTMAVGDGAEAGARKEESSSSSSNSSSSNSNIISSRNPGKGEGGGVPAMVGGGGGGVNASGTMAAAPPSPGMGPLMGTTNVEVVSTEYRMTGAHVIYILLLRFTGIPNPGWKVSRRFRQFVELHEKLTITYPGKLPSLPKKRMRSNTVDVAKKRQVHLQEYIRNVLAMDIQSALLYDFLGIPT